MDRLEALTLPRLSEVEEALYRYINAVERAEEPAAKIAETDRLIDEIVCELYGLTEAEIAIVEEAVDDWHPRERGERGLVRETPWRLSSLRDCVRQAARTLCVLATSRKTARWAVFRKTRTNHTTPYVESTASIRSIASSIASMSVAYDSRR
ncbi:hypothetical protein [Natronomonas sp.]|uniref:hypothetical protein n=1 Tax=Natronomonas sp. TaxID=2184060 RepID=UPI003974AD61